MMTVGIVGCGTIGSSLAKAIDSHHRLQARIVALTDLNRAHARQLQQSLHAHPPIVSLTELIRRSHVVIEAASVGIAADVAARALRQHRDVLVMSVGGLLLKPSRWLAVASRSRGRIHIPSGALAGLDGIKALATGPIQRIRLTTRKPPRALMTAPLVRARRIDLTRLRRPRVLFEGSPRHAIKAFPQNLNVGAALVLACASSAFARRPGRYSLALRRAISRVRVRIIADPTIHRNMHEVDVESPRARLRCAIESEPAAANPQTSESALRSALATAQQLFSSVRVGT